MIPPEEILSPSGESLIILGNLSPFGEVICSLDDKTISPSSEVLNILLDLFHEVQYKNIASRGDKDILHEVPHENIAIKGENDLFHEVQH